MMYSLVIFDCDGVLVDSEKLSAQVFSDTLRIYDVSMSANECFTTFKGLTLSDCYEVIKGIHGVSLPLSFDLALAAATLAAFDESLKPVSGIEGVVQMLKKTKIPFCVASNGGHAKIRHALHLTGLLPYFDGRIFSAQDVENGKPAPDLFLYAARKMGAAVDDCLIVEDSISGLAASKQANIDAIYFDVDSQHKHAPLTLSDTDHTIYSVQNMALLSSLLAKATANAKQC